MSAEILGGLISGSLALLADAGHMLTDFASLVLALGAVKLGKRPEDWKRSYGYDRFSVLAAFANGSSLFLIAAWITYEAIDRLREPVDGMGGLTFCVTITGLLVNIAAFWILSRGEESNLNVGAATLHVLGDLLGSIGAIVASDTLGSKSGDTGRYLLFDRIGLTVDVFKYRAAFLSPLAQVDQQL